MYDYERFLNLLGFGSSDVYFFMEVCDKYDYLNIDLDNVFTRDNISYGMNTLITTLFEEIQSACVSYISSRAKKENNKELSDWIESFEPNIYSNYLDTHFQNFLDEYPENKEELYNLALKTYENN